MDYLQHREGIVRTYNKNIIGIEPFAFKAYLAIRSRVITHLASDGTDVYALTSGRKAYVLTGFDGKEYDHKRHQKLVFDANQYPDFKGQIMAFCAVRK